MNAFARDAITRPTLIVLVLLGLLPLMIHGPSTQAVIITAMIYATGAVGLDLLTGYSDQFSFGQFVYFAIGAYVMSVLTFRLGWPWPVAVLCAVAGAGLFATVVGLALVRLKFFGIAVGTFFLGAVVFDVLAGDRLAAVTGGSNGIPVMPVSIGGIDLGSGLPLYLAAWVALAIAALLCVRYTKVRAGLAARVVKENEVVAAVLGIKVLHERVRVQAVAGIVGGLGGCVLALSLGYLSPESFTVIHSIQLFAIVAVGGAGSIVGAILGSLFFFGTINTFSTNGSAAAFIFSTVLLIVVIFLHRGIYDFVERLASLLTRFMRSRLGSGARGDQGAPMPVAEPDEARERPQIARVVPISPDGEADTLLTVSGLSVDYGGVKALTDVSLDVRRGEVHAIIGPNGAGKTTLLNCITGLQACGGEIAFDGADMSEMSVSRRREAGLARTFQHPSLVADLTALANVSIAAFPTQRTWLLAELVGTRRSREEAQLARSRALDALDVVGFPAARWATRASELTMGEQKHVDIARAVSSAPQLLLLDEPTAGLGAEEVTAVADAVRAAKAAGVTVLVIAHHVGFIREIADRCTVLDFGRVIASGTATEVLVDPRVVEVFVGTAKEQA